MTKQPFPNKPISNKGAPKTHKVLSFEDFIQRKKLQSAPALVVENNPAEDELCDIIHLDDFRTFSGSKIDFIFAIRQLEEAISERLLSPSGLKADTTLE